MSPVWYFARNDEERGPFTESQMRTLAASGKVRGEDLVWREGMPDWMRAVESPEWQAWSGTQAGEMPAAPGASRESWTPSEISSAAQVRPAPPEPPAPPPAAYDSPAQESPIAQESGRMSRAIAYLLIGIGFLGAVGAKGWESLALRNVERLDALAEIEAREAGLPFGSANSAQAPPAAMISDVGPSDSGPLASVQSAQQRLADSQQARRQDRVWGFWRQLAFLIATTVFAAGLLTMGLVGETAERCVSLLIIGVIAYSLFVGGAAWS